MELLGGGGGGGASASALALFLGSALSFCGKSCSAQLLWYELYNMRDIQQ